tara:strand:+ start:236 stop:478 length:243 start_codon:yes stop_codon:yes gene_type:complete
VVRDLGSRQESGKESRQDGVQAWSWVCRGGVIMAKMTKAQAKRMCDDARSKAEKLYLNGYMSLKDLESIIRAMNKARNKI